MQASMKLQKAMSFPAILNKHNGSVHQFISRFRHDHNLVAYALMKNSSTYKRIPGNCNKVIYQVLPQSQGRVSPLMLYNRKGPRIV